MPETQTQNVLKRELGLSEAVAIGMGAIIGAGIFVVTGVAADVAGPAFLVGLFIAGIAAACNGLSSAQLAAEYPQSGGTYEYGYQVLKPWAGFAAGWMFLVSKLAAGGAVAIGFGTYFSAIAPMVSPKTASIVAVVFLTIANYFGIKKAGKLNFVIVAITLSSLLYFCFSGAMVFKSENLQPFAPHGFTGILKAAALLFFAFTGYARLATLGEEVREPKRTIPRAIIITLVLSSLLYFAVALVAVGAIGAESMAATPSPIHAAASALNAPFIRMAVSIGAVTAMLGVLLSQLLGISRMMFAMARKSDLPQFLKSVDARTGVPHYGVFLSGGIILLFVLFGTLEWVISAAAFTILLYYSIANIAALQMPRRAKLFPDLIAVTGLIFCIILALALSFKTIISGVILLVTGFLARLVFKRNEKFPNEL